MPVPTLTRPDEAQAWVDARLAEGSDYIKIVVEDGKPYGGNTPTLDEPTLAALIKATHSRKKLAMAHVSTEDSAQIALAAGADGLVHIFTDRSPEAGFAALAAQRKAFVTPTLTVVESTTGTASGASLADDPRLARYLTAEEMQNLRRSFPRRELRMQNSLAAVRQLHEAGVPILAGSDAPNPGTTHGASTHREMEGAAHGRHGRDGGARGPCIRLRRDQRLRGRQHDGGLRLLGWIRRTSLPAASRW